MEKNKKSFLKTKKIILILGIISIISGLFFINKSPTGNTIITSLANSSYFSYLDIVGISLILCSIILGTHYIKIKQAK